MRSTRCLPTKRYTSLARVDTVKVYGTIFCADLFSRIYETLLECEEKTNGSLLLLSAIIDIVFEGWVTIYGPNDVLMSGQRLERWSNLKILSCQRLMDERALSIRVFIAGEMSRFYGRWRHRPRPSSTRQPACQKAVINTRRAGQSSATSQTSRQAWPGGTPLSASRSPHHISQDQCRHLEDLVLYTGI